MLELIKYLIEAIKWKYFYIFSNISTQLLIFQKLALNEWNKPLKMILSADELYFLDGKTNRNICLYCSYQEPKISKHKSCQDFFINENKVPFRLEKVKNSDDFTLLRTYELFLFRHRINPEFFCKYKKALWLVETSTKKYVYSTPYFFFIC